VGARAGDGCAAFGQTGVAERKAVRGGILGADMPRRSPRPLPGPRPSIPDPRPHLLAAVLDFVCAARTLPGVRRISLLGSLTRGKHIPKDADVLVTIDESVDFPALARLGRSLKGSCQHINLGADIFIADGEGRYLGRVCGYKECFPRVRCRARHCMSVPHLNDDLHIVTLDAALVAAPPIDLWPQVVRRCVVPQDTEVLLVGPLEVEQRVTPDSGASP
jgi:hypothetical protein